MAPKRARNQAGSSSRSNEPPKWKSESLSTLPKEWQPRLYREKMDKIKSLDEAIVAERHVKVEDFRNYGLVEGFERLGWMAALTINSEGDSKVYLEELVEWMSTLEKETGDNPPWTTRITGSVNGVPVELSVNTLRQIAQFDTLEAGNYEQVSDGFIRGDFKGEIWIDMLRELFDVPEARLSETMILEVDDLKPLPRLVMKILTWNVVPRKSDKLKVRTADVRPLYAIVTGGIRFSFCQLLMLNVWDSHESSKKTSIPHCRVLSELLVRANVIGRNAKPRVVTPKFFSRATLTRGDFAFKETFTHFVLHDSLNGRIARFAKPEQGEGEQGAVRGEEREFENYGIHEPGRPYPGRPSVYQNWDEYQRMMWDNNQYHWEEQRLRDRRAEERRASFEEGVNERITQMGDDIRRIRQDVEVMSYYQQRYHHDMYDWAEQQRHWHDFNNQREYRPHNERQDFSAMMRLDESGPSQPPPPYPEMNHPQWWPGEYQTHGGNSSSQHPEVQDPFDTRDLSRGLYESIFGPDR